MWISFYNFLKRDKLAQALLLLFFVLAVWWLILQVLHYEYGDLGARRDLLWAACYQSVAILGGVVGLAISNSWGSARSVMGRAVLSFALGLLLQVFGQSTFSFYNLVLNVDVPYPSLADIGFFGSIPFYIYCILLLARASRVKISLGSFLNQLKAVCVPLLMLTSSYLFFLRGYLFDWSQPLKVLLDFGYPFGQTIYVSITILTYLLSKGVLGGIMRSKILFLLFALVIQYVADYNFLYQAANMSWRNGGYGDFIYLLAYLLMALGLLQLRVTLLHKDLSG